MMSIPKPMTKKQLKDVVCEYATAFPDWTIFEDNAFVREHGPIQQMIWFQKLRSGAYRPTHVVRALPIVISRMLTQMLDVRNRETDYKRHKTRWRDVVGAMEQQFKPSIRKPLDIAEVASLCEAEARETTNDLVMLAILYAWLGRRDKALSCCTRMQSCAPPTLAPVPEWEEQMKAFGRALAQAVETGAERGFLETAIGVRSQALRSGMG
jgi:hypothetical protein